MNHVKFIARNPIRGRNDGTRKSRSVWLLLYSPTNTLWSTKYIGQPKVLIACKDFHLLITIKFLMKSVTTVE